MPRQNGLHLVSAGTQATTKNAHRRTLSGNSLPYSPEQPYVQRTPLHGTNTVTCILQCDIRPTWPRPETCITLTNMTCASRTSIWATLVSRSRRAEHAIPDRVLASTIRSPPEHGTFDSREPRAWFVGAPLPQHYIDRSVYPVLASSSREYPDNGVRWVWLEARTKPSPRCPKGVGWGS